jgi:transcriptional regulator with XRE-family HTH domain
MSIELAGVEGQNGDFRESGTGFPELTALGKRIEMLRIERGLSKQLLARGAGTSRQQLWRVMTGKSELTGTLGQRLADVLQVELRALRGLEMVAGANTSWTTGSATSASATLSIGPATLAEFLGDPSRLQGVLAALPRDEHGARMRTALLDALREAATAAGLGVAPAQLEPTPAG